MGIGLILAAWLGKTRRDATAERVLFALVANRALDRCSKLPAAHWVGRKAWIDWVARDHRRRVLQGDWLASPGQGRGGAGVFGQVANLLNLEEQAKHHRFLASADGIEA